jgi:protein-S-isoprenylcysteine O-methyltransferase Ste14
MSSQPFPDRQKAEGPLAPRPRHGFACAAAALVMLLALPLLVYYLWMSLEFNHGWPLTPSATLLGYVPRPTWSAMAIVVAWFVFQALLQIFCPGKWVEGTPLSDGRRLRYKMNGWFSWWATWAAAVAGVATGLWSPTLLADRFGSLLTATNIFTYLFCCYLYWQGRSAAAPHERAARGILCDFWVGTALNPRVGSFDLKLFCEARPGLTLWILIDFSLAAKQYEMHGTITSPMILVCAFQFWYVADYYFHEEAILTTWDIKHENFGWMLCWGDLVWVPFTYTIQAYYLVEHTHDLSWWVAGAIVLLNIAGYVVFRGANGQKHRFRADPTRPVLGSPPTYIKTANGLLLLTCGWWGLSRHMNYLGDLLMALAWCLPCLFGSPLPYFYVAYLTILLVHRERRDNAMCAARYGKDWSAYCEKVPYRIIPGVY